MKNPDRYQSICQMYCQIESILYKVHSCKLEDNASKVILLILIDRFFYRLLFSECLFSIEGGHVPVLLLSGQSEQLFNVGDTAPLPDISQFR